MQPFFSLTQARWRLLLAAVSAVSGLAGAVVQDQRGDTGRRTSWKYNELGPTLHNANDFGADSCFLISMQHLVCK